MVIPQSLKASIRAVLILENGAMFWGRSIEGEGTAFGEICFNTSMTGYQEVFTDPSYFGQIVVMSNAHIGNYGVSVSDKESDTIKVRGVVCRNFSYSYSRISATSSLQSFFKEGNLFGLTGVDTRALVSYIRDYGSMNAVISTRIDELDVLKKELSQYASMKGLELASKVSTSKAYDYGNSKARYRVAVLDLGVKKSILDNLTSRDVYIRVCPYDTVFEDLNDWNPDGYFISNGPGDPEPLKAPQQFALKALKAEKPLFGICLGHQVIALASGISTFKMYNGHRGINHSVLNLTTNLGEITSQNHGFSIDRKQTERNKNLSITHININDDTVAGIQTKNGLCFSVQYHPEAGPGPNDAKYLFDKYIEVINKNKKL